MFHRFDSIIRPRIRLEALRFERNALRSEARRSRLCSRPSSVRRRWMSAAAAALIAVTIAAWTRAAELDSPNAAAELQRHTQYLASPELTGRGVDTPGINLARDYIAAEFTKAGLKP